MKTAHLKAFLVQKISLTAKATSIIEMAVKTIRVQMLKVI
jgi:hypothetical protein